MNIDFFRNNNINVDWPLKPTICARAAGDRDPGAVVDRQKFANSTVTTVKVVEQQAAQMMGKPVGTYITIEAPALRDNTGLPKRSG